MLSCQKPPKRRKQAIKKNGISLNLKTAEGKRLYEARTYEMSLAQGCLCAICRQLMLEPTFDHALGRGHGGGHRDDRAFDEAGNQVNAAVCVKCNGIKGSKRYAWIGGLYLPVTKFKGEAA